VCGWRGFGENFNGCSYGRGDGFGREERMGVRKRVGEVRCRMLGLGVRERVGSGGVEGWVWGLGTVYYFIM
jgi:hypothetical protein